MHHHIYSTLRSMWMFFLWRAYHNQNVRGDDIDFEMQLQQESRTPVVARYDIISYLTSFKLAYLHALTSCRTTVTIFVVTSMKPSTLLACQFLPCLSTIRASSGLISFYPSCGSIISSRANKNTLNKQNEKWNFGELHITDWHLAGQNGCQAVTRQHAWYLAFDRRQLCFSMFNSD